MKLQKVKAYKLDKDRWQYKYIITIPESSIDELGWKEGTELVNAVDGDGLRISLSTESAKPKRRVITTKMSYEEFRDKVRDLLQFKDNGMTWTEIRNEIGLDQVVPNNKWVRRMETDIGLMRVKGNDGTILWQIKHV